ncbi:AVAST type 1 anti-phage system protease Avs1b [Marinicellulosiphila megalodicopiae]|uniref:AVAST type 1 anti-phage system protease Avs1b n=1 Tax=Marinicellulosiphila megalodicopiae TaxID=2724896 RepID=UPI003BB04F2B
MLENIIKNATCRIECGEDTDTDIGTGWLISPDKIITVRHCVINAFDEDDKIDESVPITIKFAFLESPVVLNAKIIGYEKGLDVCLLSIEKISDIAFIPISKNPPLSGSEIYSYGWPVCKLNLGHRLEGTISQVLETPKLGMDAEIHVDNSSLDCYEGFSGAPLICGEKCVGLIRVSIANSIGVISILSIHKFLSGQDIFPEDILDDNSATDEFASREKFNLEFDTFIENQSGKYTFIEGAHGIGKSTFCKTYKPTDPTIEYFNTYSLTSNTTNAMQLAQPQEYVNWLNMKVSLLLTKSSGRIVKRDYADLIKEAKSLLSELAEYYKSRGKIGVFFIDGLDELEKLDSEILNAFVGLLPEQVSEGLVLVLSSPSYTRLSANLGARLGNEDCISLPPLTDSVVQDYCRQALERNHATVVIIDQITSKSQGHPLYLRYLIDLVNSGIDDTELAELPLINGSIRNYYENLWSQLNSDSDATNLLAIISRLRGGITIQQFSEILDQTEQAVLVSTIARVKHLLLSPEKTTIYHSSFSEFLVEKTQVNELNVQLRLAQYCEKNIEKHYCLLNIIYHGLKSGSNSTKAHTVALCNQKWVDDCVLMGIKPDTLLSDVNNVLSVATELGSLIETVRILLLTQRVQFRYDTLFAQSAVLIAEALISLGKTEEVLQHVIRYGGIIIPIPQALKIAMLLIDANDRDDAFKLLNIIESSIDEQLEFAYVKDGISFENFLYLYDLQVQQLNIKELASSESSDVNLQKFHFYWMKNIDVCSTNKEVSKFIRSEMSNYFHAALMCLSDRYISIEKIKVNFTGSLIDLVEPLIFTASYYRELCIFYNKVPNPSLVKQLLDDMDMLIKNGLEESNKIHNNTIDNLISLGASQNSIQLIMGEVSNSLSKIQFIDENNVSINGDLLDKGYSKWRLESFVNTDLSFPELITLSPSNWLDGIESILRIIAWCEGAGARLKNTSDDENLTLIWAELQNNVFSQLKFTLADRVQWEDSYAIPESVFPYIYQRLVSLVTEIFPTHLDFILLFIDEQFEFQCGLYSEGFRAVLVNILDNITRVSLEDDVEDKAFALLERWQKFVLSNLKNRHELVPELLTIIPIFVRLQASEEALKTHQCVLAFSMGPSWYKEDQLGLMTTALDSLSNDLPIEPTILPKIAGLLDEASGEMTFQRFVRYAKRDFIGALCKRGIFNGAVNYFIRQSYGTTKQLYEEASNGDIDRVSPLRGGRFPGGALDEQDAIWSIVESAIPVADWSLCWAILEIYQFEDSRHLKNFANGYALLIKKIHETNEDLTLVLERLELVCESEIEKNEISNFLSYVKNYLPSELVIQFENKFENKMDLSNRNEFTQNTAFENSTEHEEVDLSEEQADSDDLLLPGFFGTKESVNNSNTAVSKAERHLRRHNYGEAQKEAINGLELIQLGGWPIWNDQMGEAESILLETTESASDLVKLCSQLILNEHNSNSWQIASHLITWVSKNADQTEQETLVNLAIEHTEIMVKREGNIGEVGLFSDVEDTDIFYSLIKLLVHAMDHPTWLRREKSADMVLWLLRNNSEYIPIFGPKAFSMNSSNHPDILCGVFDQLSKSNSESFWDQLLPALDIDLIKQECKHIGRLIVLERIAKRASQRGSESADKALISLKEVLSETSKVVPTLKNTEIELPKWAETIWNQWSKLNAKGLISQKLVDLAFSQLTKQCLPLTVDECLEVEQLLDQGYVFNSKKNGRWDAKVTFAFQVALNSITDSSVHTEIEGIFRNYNPVRLDNIRLVDFHSPTIDWLNQLKDTKATFQPSNGRSMYLDFCERVWFDGSYKHFRITAYFFGNEASLPLPAGRFYSNEEPELGKASNWDTCVNVLGLPVYLGSFTPATPTANFMRITGASSSDLSRKCWRSGRVVASSGGGPESEGCFLAIDKNALRLPSGIRLAWVCEINGKSAGIITQILDEEQV